MFNDKKTDYVGFKMTEIHVLKNTESIKLLFSYPVAADFFLNIHTKVSPLS